MELIKINTDPREIPPSQRKKRSFRLGPTSPTLLNKQISDETGALSAEGFTIFRLNFYTTDPGDDDREELRCRVEGSRLETPKEVEKRVAQQTRYNDTQMREHRERLAAIAIRKEIARIAGHLSLEVLKRLPRLEAPEDQPSTEPGKT